MIRERPELASTIAGQTCDRQHVSTRGSGRGASLLRVVLILCCVMMIYGSNKVPRGIKELRDEMKNPRQALGYCDFEVPCNIWFWNRTSSFTRVTASSTSVILPSMDADNSTNGHFLWYRGPGYGQTWSMPLPRSIMYCRIEFWIYQVEMQHGGISLIVVDLNNSSVMSSKNGNNRATWERVSFEARAATPSYRLFLEVYAPFKNSSVAIDNVRLTNCFTGNVTFCTDDMFLCNEGTCLNRSQVCDLTYDCPGGEDELFGCDKIPEHARCNFQSGWCGWKNVSGRPLGWTLHSGPTPTDRTGPNLDHTYRNKTGIYAFVNMAQKSASGANVAYGSRATLESPLYNPTPPYSSDPMSPYFHSCQIRFYYHKYGTHAGSLGLYLVQVKPYGNYTDRIWWSYGDKLNADIWIKEVVALPEVKYRYFLQFEASKGFTSKGDIAIDDISFSPECFAIGVPPKVVGNFNYYNPLVERTLQHPDFENETVVRITACGATGRTGPTIEQCAEEHNGSDIELMPSLIIPTRDMSAFNLSGIQRWTAPRGEYYTLIGVGARGGMGSGGMGSTLGSVVRGVIELQKGDQLYFIVGQMGTNACPKNLGLTTVSCNSQAVITPRGSLLPHAFSSKVREVKNLEFKNGGGGGGGATAIFMLRTNSEPEPILVAGGGGGLGYGHFIDDGFQHGRGPVPVDKHLRPPSEIAEDIGNTSTCTRENTDTRVENTNLRRNLVGGPGGSWNASWADSFDPQDVVGMSLIHGGLGGFGCELGKNESYGDGGFGGGGGGCQTGGGGGGYIGGNTGHKDSGNGEGGYSYASLKLTNIHFKDAAHYGPGEILIIPAISGCGCDYRCVALDQFLSETKCLCPQGWLLSNDSKSCIMIEDTKDIIRQTYMIPLICIIMALFVIVIIGVTYYNRYQNQKALLHRRHAMFGNGTELSALHGMPESSMELNPNYELDGNLYNLKDLPQIPHKNITLIKALGQGAFGEVYQGMCRIDSEEHPVAIKTLPSLSTMQAEADFMMEALIMSKFTHSNIVKFIGVSFEKHPRYIILELLAGGDLKNFLREERPRPDRATSLTMHDLITCSFDVANGCKYLEEAHFIHRDIAARNCLLTTKGPGRTVKIADFGMARDIYRSDYYKKDGKAMLPVKWMPPESFLDGIFTSKTDVWSFGILLWEIMSFGYMPYTGCTNREVISMVTAGGRLENPAGCPDPIYGIMTQCWHPRPNDRPSFANIVQSISYCLQDPSVINHPTPNFDILPICDRETTIMRPDPSAECINVQSELDKRGYMQPKIISSRSAARNKGHIISGVIYNIRDEKIRSGDLQIGTFGRSECRQGTYGCNAYDFTQDTFRQAYDDENDYDDNYDDEMTEDCEDKCGVDQSDWQDSRTIHRTNNIEDGHNADNGNNRPDEDYHLIDSAKTDRRNGNESTTTTDTNSASLIARSSDTPPDTTNSSPNTRTCSPNRTAGLNNVNGTVKRNTLKATLSLDASALCRNTIPYEKITTQRSSTPGSMELRKDSLGHELPREEECSC
ncbi:ALK tyrosine kinase receptor isoform X2 [Ooceraea biroi]|uniref:ALK tyrosine kinase receptor isoform X2 n=1 Tax=Ooceraea biroi TaxID=2015173 RepID=UPI000F0893B8|nr:ALK tyrosine kinase receptor isoform X2 [Ooceraea biroi]